MSSKVLFHYRNNAWQIEWHQEIFKLKVNYYLEFF